MIPELGQIALILAFVFAIVLAVVPMWGAHRNDQHLMRLSFSATAGMFVFVATAFAALTYAFIAQDFSVQYVQLNSNAQLPLVYRYTAVWGGHEGSKLLWALVLAGWTLAVAARSSSLPLRFTSRLLATLGFIASGFLGFLLFTSNPFVRFLPSAPDGNDLNPLLQDPGMIVHPPMLYMGYVGLAVPFAFAVAALIEGKMDQQWVRWTRPWTLIAWMFLTVGIALGSWWAYYELGWGGWWFWDPVENASFMPWLIATALIHSQAVTEKRGTFVNWTLLLSIAGFSLSLLGTFLVRSGILTSVHAFASDPKRGSYILTFLVLVTGIALVLYALRAPRMQNVSQAKLLSKESLLLFNNVVLVSSCVLVLWGTLWPLITEAVMKEKVSVGAPWFSMTFSWVIASMLLLIPLGAFTRWQAQQGTELINKLRMAAVVSFVIALLILLTYRASQWKVVLGVVAAAWIATATVYFLLTRWRMQTSAGAQRFTLEMWAMSIAHIGVAAWLMGVVFTETLSTERDVRLSPGQSVQVGPYEVTMERIEPVEGPNYVADQGVFTLRKGEEVIATLMPQKRRYAQGKIMTEAAIDPSLFRDVYVALGEPLDASANEWGVRAYHKPFIRLIWLGALLMGFGGLLAACERRLRKPVSATSSQPQSAPLAPQASAAT
jgi:cytochrome c-type biogenesis protein CcmF